jgi:hypothetical protein
MGFYLWVAGDVAWAQGTYEYRPMGMAVVAVSDLFTRRDFDSRRKNKPPAGAHYMGQFASLGQLNGVLQRNRRPPQGAGATGSPATGKKPAAPAGKLNPNRYRASAAARRDFPSRA